MTTKAMNNDQLNGYLELIAKLVELTAITPEEAAEIIRSAKVPVRGKKEKPVTSPSTDK